MSLRTIVIQIQVWNLNVTTQDDSFSLNHQTGELANPWWRWRSTDVPTNLRPLLNSRGRTTRLFKQYLKSYPEHLGPSLQSLAPKRNYCIPHSCPFEDQRMIMTSSTAALIPTTRDTRGKSDENQLGVSKKPSPNKWIKRKAAPLIAASAVYLVDTGIWWLLIVAIQRSFTRHVITQVPSPGLPQEESAPRRKQLHCLSVRKGKELWTQDGFNEEAI